MPTNTPEPNQPAPKQRPALRLTMLFLCVVLGVGGAFWLQAQRDSGFVNAARDKLSRIPILGEVANNLSQNSPFNDVVAPPTRPYGMTPQAFAAFLRACKTVGIHPYRIGQTIGNHPRSVGYHKRDGAIVFNGAKIDYCAAVDLGTQDMTESHIQWFLSALTREGFACWYRSGPRWKGGEHIHAIYASLEMKPQLEEQVRDFLRQRRRKGLAKLKWEKQFRKLN